MKQSGEDIYKTIATAKTVRTFLIAETIAITASSFFLLPSSFFLLLYLSEVFKEVSWYPESVCTIDICESEGELYVLELGSFSCAGEYACDLSAIVEFGAKAAWFDCEAANQF